MSRTRRPTATPDNTAAEPEPPMQAEGGAGPTADEVREGMRGLIGDVGLARAQAAPAGTALEGAIKGYTGAPHPTPGRTVLYRFRASDGCRVGAVGELRPGTVITVHPEQFVDRAGYGVRVHTALNDFDDARGSHFVGDAAYGTGPGEIHYPPRS